MVAQRLPWLVATVVAVRAETPTTRTIVLDAEGWTGHLAGQHVDLRLTAPDGYSTQRSYSIASPTDRSRLELTVQRVPEGEVSPYLVDELSVGDQLELRGPIGGWFVWRPEETAPMLLIAGGSGVVPLMAMVRDRARVQSSAPFMFVYSVRSPTEVYYADELARLAHQDSGLDVNVLYTRSGVENGPRAPGRITADDLKASGWAPEDVDRTYVCGPTGFVEAVVMLLLAQGHDSANIRTERFGPTGG